MFRKFVIFLFSLSVFSLVKAQTPVANFSADITVSCGTTVITFRDLSTNNPTSWLWDFGDGTTPSTVQNPVHTYSAPGTFSVKLTATNANGSNTKIRNQYIIIHQPPAIGFSSDRTSGCVPQNINFTDITSPGSSPLVSWLWDFGDGNSSTQRNPSHLYPVPGLYNVALAVTDSNGCVSRIYRDDYLNIQTYPTAAFTATNRIGCNTPLAVNFINSSSGIGPITYQWNFGDGGTSTQTNPSHTYITRGNFDVTLIARNSAGCADTLTLNDYVQINDANFSADVVSGCVPFDVSFTNTSTAGDSAWSWNFGDGGSSNQRDPMHTYSMSGVYTVTLTVYYRGGCSVTKTMTGYIRANAVPIVNFSVSDSNQCKVPFNVTFTNLTPGTQSATWIFGDGSSSTTTPVVNHTYTDLGQYNVTLSVINSSGCTGTLTRPNLIQIVKPTARFITNQTQGCKPLPVMFTDNSSSNSPIVSWYWNFGDGATDNTQNPFHIYNTPFDTARFNVYFRIINADGCRDSTTFSSIFVGTPPTVRFSADYSTGCHPFSVHFTDLSTGYVNGWNWNFGDNGTEVAQNPDHEYRDTTGYFPVQLIASRYGCPDTLTIDSFIYVLPPKPKFRATPMTGCHPPLNVTFTDMSTGATSWKWDFGDGTISTQQNPSHLYTTAGFYTVKLRVSNSNGCMDSITMTNYIKIAENRLGFITSDNTICKNETIIFTDTSWCNTYFTNWQWDYGDGTGFSTVVNQPQSHTYPNAGTFNVKLVVTDVLGCKDSITKFNNVIVYELPVIHFGALTVTGCSPLSVPFRDTITAAPGSTITRRHWDFGVTTLNNDTSNIHNPTYRYLSPGSYTVTLTATDSRGCFNSLTKPNLIYPTHPAPDFAYPSLVCYSENAWFSNTSQGVGLQYTWSFGDGSPVSHQPNPNHFYTVTATRTFNVSLTATDINGCDSTVTKTITVSRPVIDFYADTANLFYCPPLFVQFYDSSSSDVNQWQWIFDDPGSGSADISTVRDAQHVYNNIGVFDVTLIGTNTDGCTDTLTKPRYIRLEGPRANPFIYLPASGCSPLEVAFYPNNAINVAHYRWIFGDGNVSTQDSVTHIYSAGGSYLSALEISDTLGCVITIVADTTIQVVSGIPDFFVDTTFACSTTTFHFNDSSTTIGGAIDTWLWDFGDGTTSSLQNPDHEYSIPGAYDVTLTITIDSCVYTIVKDDYINIYTAPLLQFTAADTVGCEPLEVQFGVVSSPAADSVTFWQWNFGDGPETSNDREPTHIYDSSATYPVSIYVVFENGCQHTYLRPTIVVVYPMPNADFTYDSGEIYADLPITFRDSSSSQDPIASWVWDFGDGQSGNDSVTSHIFDYIGDYDVTLTVTTSPYGCQDTVTKTITIPARIMDYNAFSPDGDGTNDKFGEKFDLVILNRWGQKIYEGKEGWDGTFNGQKASEGTYYFIITIDEVKGQKPRILKGSLTLLRKTH